MKRFELENDGQKVTLKIKGSIDENFQFPKDLKGELLVIDFDELKTFNSMGIRIWINWTPETKNNFKKVHLVNCRNQFISQLAYIRDLVPAHASVESFYVPLYDPKDESGKDVKMVRGVDYDETGYKIPKVESPLGGFMEVDVPERYFGFIKAPPRS
jgi:hypothetical protein